ncbi:thioredoxin family protein [Candidatus Xianfuyuplasma coldseepsis]|uniref:Thioredoxin family protein n=1 Tax=Candidatus Xianfuyuplasma coldseepsis TaxID=2782163 RepID=A0A7L7KPN4_9MOLU|nr:thioredoxin family protein [Xianfuyuplasma coldseepsis]QMS84637.1 thioredoxin family protein [Xianfuyuplasma coldseepsis]
MNIKILGSGCPNCKRLEQHVREALVKLDLSAEVEKVTDYKDMMVYNIMSTPGLVIDEKLVSSGRVLKVQEVMELLQK